MLRKNLSSTEFKEIDQKDLSVGDIIMCLNEMTFPADIALLTSSADGDCFIATSSLDGEKNLKKRVQANKLKEHISANEVNAKQLLEIQG